MRLLLLAVVLLGALQAPSALAARPEPRDLGPLPQPIRSDGARFATWSDGSVVRVVDTRERRSFLVDVPERCGHTAVGGGQLLFSCQVDLAGERCRYAEAPLLYSIRLREFHWPAGIKPLIARQGETTAFGTCYSHAFFAVGRYWIGYYEHYGKGYTRHALQWHDGRSEPQAPKERARNLLDLDEADQTAELCRPLRREQSPYWRGRDDEDPQFLPYAFMRPFGLRGARASEEPGLYLERCGSSGRRSLTSNGADSGLAPRVAYWRVGYRLHINFLRSGRREVYDFGEAQPALPGGDWMGLLRTAATRARIYVTLSPPGKDPRTFVIRVPER